MDSSALAQALQDYQDAKRQELIGQYTSKLGTAVGEGLAPAMPNAVGPNMPTAPSPSGALSKYGSEFGLDALKGLKGNDEDAYHKLISSHKFPKARF